MWREERDWSISPVIHLPRWTIEGIKLKHRQQLNSCNTERLKIRDLFDYTGESASYLFAHSGIRILREPFHMHFVNDRPRCRAFERFVTFPVIRSRIDDHALHGRRGVINSVRTHSRVVSGDNNTTAIRIKENFGIVKMQPSARVERSVGTIAIDLPHRQIWNEDVPVVICAIVEGIQRDCPCGSHVVCPIKEEQV